MKHLLRLLCLTSTAFICSSTYLIANDPLIPDDHAPLALPSVLGPAPTQDTPQFVTSTPSDTSDGTSKDVSLSGPYRSEKASTPTVETLPSSHDFMTCFEKGNSCIKESDFRGAVNAYKQAIACDTQNRAEPYFNIGVAYTILDEQENAVDAFRKAIERRSSYTKAHLYLAKTLTKLKRPEEAHAHFRIVLDLDASNWEAQASMGRWCVSKEKFNDAIPYLEKASQLNSKDIQLMFEHANALNTVNRLDEALDIYKKTLERVPNSVAVIYNIAYSLKRLNRVEEAMHYYDEVIKRQPEHSEAQFSRGLAHIMTGNWKEGWKGYEWRWKRGDNKPLHMRYINKPMWDGKTDLHGKTFLVTGEQGLGDTFQFIRYAREIKKKGARVIAHMQAAPLKPIAATCPYIDEVVDITKQMPEFDEHAPLPSLPYLLSTDIDTVPNEVPYLYADPVRVAEWNQRLSHDKNFRVGLCWHGNINYQTAFLRAVVGTRPIPLEALIPLGDIPGVSFYHLQKGTAVDQIKTMPSSFQIKSFGIELNDFMDTAVLMSTCDLILTIDTSVAHLAGGLGKPTWVMMNEPSDWRWMFKRDDSPWYPNMRLFRQPTPGDWESVVANVAKELRSVVAYHQSTQFSKGDTH